MPASPRPHSGSGSRTTARNMGRDCISIPLTNLVKVQRTAENDHVTSMLFGLRQPEILMHDRELAFATFGYDEITLGKLVPVTA